jgi:hypothetical protein
VFHPPQLLEAWEPGQPRQSRLVLITRDLDREMLLNSLKAFEAAAQ